MHTRDNMKQNFRKTNSYYQWYNMTKLIGHQPITAYQMEELNSIGYKQNIRMFRELAEVDERFELTKVGRAIAIVKVAS